MLMPKMESLVLKLMFRRRKRKSSARSEDQHRVLAILEQQNSGAKLSLFADWAAGRELMEVERALRILDVERQLPQLAVCPIERPTKTKVVTLPRRS
jgi:hypothetical protein